ncbi:MAG: hypothetical protein WBV93_00030, partial [Anaerobacillus sp.]
EGNRGVKLTAAARRVAVTWPAVASGGFTDYVPLMVVATIRNNSSCRSGLVRSCGRNHVFSS